MSPRREGCTLTISLGPKSQNLAIMAVRFQVGSTSSDSIPKKVFVQGRPVELAAGIKKWYSISLSDEEIALTMRSGVLGIGISQAFDATSNPLLDSLEVYAVERQAIESWLPRVLCNEVPISSAVGEECVGDSRTPGAVVMACRSLESLCDILGPAKSLPKTESDLLKRMVQDTAVSHDRVIRESIDSLLSRLYPSPQARNSVKDEGALQGCSLLLNRCQLLLEETQNQMSDDEDSLTCGSFDRAWFTVRTLLRSVLRTSSHIARCRPINYFRASDVIAENKISSGSIAVDSSKLISEGIRRSLPCEDLCELFVELSLAESAIGDNTGTDQGETLASFIIVRKLLECNNLEIVERSCHAISSFCRSYGTGDQSRGERSNDLFEALHKARVVCYQCDNCGQSKSG